MAGMERFPEPVSAVPGKCDARTGKWGTGGAVPLHHAQLSEGGPGGIPEDAGACGAGAGGEPGAGFPGQPVPLSGLAAGTEGAVLYALPYLRIYVRAAVYRR